LLLDITPAKAVILYRTGDPTANTTAPGLCNADLHPILGVPVTYSIEQSMDLF